VNVPVARLHLAPSSPSWPVELEELEGPPAELWIRGRIGLLDVRPRIALVGTRAPTPYGEGQAERFGRAFAAAGACVVSGLARGIDQAAHRAALDARGATIAVLGSGIDRPWPQGELAERIAREGLLLSEFHPGQGPRPHHFPMRNRLISGLCRAVVVIEAAHASGSLITARWAADQGRDVYALPGRVDHPMSRGTHRLLREGAQLVEDPEEVLADLGLAGGPPGARRDAAAGALTEAQRALAAALRGETRTSEELAQALRVPLGEVLVRLVEGEMAGLVRRLPGGRYQLAEPR
jgi:DNA processing protein